LEGFSVSDIAPILDGIRDIVSIIDSSNIYRFVNHNYCKAIDRPFQAIVGQSVADIWGQQIFSASIENEIKRCFSGELFEYEKWIIFGKLGKKCMLISYIPCYNNGIINYVCVINRDITDSKLLEEKHKELGKAFKSLEKIKSEWVNTIDSIEDIIIHTDSNGNIKRFNKAFKEFLRTDYNDIIGKKVGAVLESAGFPLNDNLFNNNLFNNINQYKNSQNGKWYNFKTSFFTEMESQIFSGLVLVIHDITSLKKQTSELESAYRQLKEKQLQIAHQEKLACIGQLAAGIAHELNNPIGYVKSNLNSLSKYTDVIKEIFSALHESTNLSNIKMLIVEKNIPFILSDLAQLTSETIFGINQASEIIKNLKDFSHLDSNRKSEHLNINDLLDNALLLSRNEIKYYAEVKKNYIPLMDVSGVSNELTQVFLNIIVNAAQAIRSYLKQDGCSFTQGTITLETGMDKSNCFVKIGDNGPGISLEHQSRVFEPFFTTKPVGSGTGLGLNISYDIIVNRHGGSIDLESSPGHTVFTVKLPLKKS